MKIRRLVNLRFRIMTSTVVAMGFCFFIMLLIIWITLFNSFQETAKVNFLTKGQKYANAFESKINQSVNYLSIMTGVLEEQIASGFTNREQLHRIFYRTFSNYEVIDGSSIIFEPNMYDQKDSEYIGSPYGTANSGSINYYFYSKNGETIFLPQSGNDDVMFKDLHYQDAKAANAPVYTKPFIYTIDGVDISAFTLTYPINDKEGNFIGAVTADIFLGELYSQLQNETIYKTGYITISGSHGIVLYSPVFDDIGKDRTYSGLDYSRPKNEEPLHSNALSRINGKNSFVTTLGIHIQQLDTDFYVSVVAPNSEIFASMIYLSILLALLSVSVFTAIILILSEGIVKPVKDITHRANIIASGHLDEVAEFDDMDESLNTKNEIHILYMALKKTFYQLSEAQKTRLKALEFKHEKEKAEEASRTKTVFLAKMSHEIRTPMNAIIGMSELILRENIPPVIHEHALSIKHAGANLLSIINDILDFSKIESGKLEIVPVEYSFASLINDVSSIIRMRIMEKSILFVVNADCNIPNKLFGDEVRLRQVLLNILGNAVNYTNEGFISFDVKGEISGDTITLTFKASDSGIGIKEEDAGKLFVDFVQLDMAKNKGVTGTGLGLPITKSLCLAMGGDVYVESKYGEGSTFTIVMPQKIIEPDKLAHVDSPNEKRVMLYEPRSVYAESIVKTFENLGVECVSVYRQSDFSSKLKQKFYNFIFISSFLLESVRKIIDELDLSDKIVLLAEYGEGSSNPNLRTVAMPVYSVPIANILNYESNNIGYMENNEPDVRFTAPTARILIVDDINTNLKVAEGLMLPYKLQIDTCMSGADAIELVKMTKYDAIFMDHMMPEMDGIETTTIIRSFEDKNDYFKNIPIIALTANAMSGVREMFLQNGFNDFLGKPIETQKLGIILDRWIPPDKKEKYKKEELDSKMPELEIDGIDVKTGIFMTGGNFDNYLSTLSVFYSDGLEKIEQLKDCVETNNIKLYVTYVHAIKGAAASIGAAEISGQAKRLEKAGKNMDLKFIMENNETFLKKFEVVLKSISDVISVQSTNEHPDDYEINFLSERIAKLKEALENMDIREIDSILNQIGAKKWDTKISGIIQNISMSVLLFEYDEAINSINELLIEIS